MNRLPSQNTERDRQRQRVYKWEEQIFPADLLFNTDRRHFMSRLEVHKLANRLAGSQNVRWRIDVKDSRRHKSAEAAKYGRWIIVPVPMRTEIIVAHETAHCVVGQNERLRGCEYHGPEFVSIYIELLGELGYSKTQLRASAVDMGVRVADER